MKLEPQCKTQEQLFIEMARVCRMCEGIDISVWSCVKVNGGNNIKCTFSSPVDSYEFAIAIVEGKPVFRGDKLYNKDGIEFIAGRHNMFCEPTFYSWNSPKPKTLTIELPYDDVVHWSKMREDKISNIYKTLAFACGKALDKL